MVTAARDVRVAMTRLNLAVFTELEMMSCCTLTSWASATCASTLVRIPPFASRQFPVEHEGNSHFSMKTQGDAIVLQMLRPLETGVKIYSVDSTIKFGGEFRRQNTDAFSYTPGTFTFPTVNAFLADQATAFTANTSNRSSRKVGNTSDPAYRRDPIHKIRG